MNHKTIERDGKPFVLVPKKSYERMCAALEDRNDIRAYDRAKAQNPEMVPAALADRLLAGENPIRVWRAYRELTQDQLASKVGIAKPYLSQIETGKRAASVDVLRRLARALGLDLDDIVSDVMARDTVKQVRAYRAVIRKQLIGRSRTDAFARPGLAGAKKRRPRMA